MRADLLKLYAEGYRSIAIVLAHSYLLPKHEQQVAAIARDIGFDNISASAEIEAKIGFVARGQSASADAYLTPEVKKYLNGFTKGFENRLAGSDCRVSFMQSDGALADFRKFSGLRAILCELSRGGDRVMAANQSQLVQPVVWLVSLGPHTILLKDHLLLASIWVER